MREMSSQFGARARRIAAVAAAFAAMSIGDGGALARTLKESVAITIARHPEIQRDRALNSAADKGIDQAFSGYYPTLDLDQEFGYEWTNSPSTRTRVTRETTVDGRDPGGVSRVRRDSSATLRQMMFDGFATDNRVSSARALNDTATSTVAETSERVALRVVQLYLDVLRTKELVDIAEDNITELTTITGQIRELAKGGRGTSSDVDQAESRLAQGRATLEQRRGERQAAIARYIEVVGELPSDLIRPGIPQYQRPSSEEDAVGIALARNPSAQASAAFYRARTADAKAAEAPFYPRLDVEVLASTGSNLDGAQGRDSDINPRLRLRYNVFNGFGDAARRDRTLEEAVAAREDDSEQRRRIREDVRVAYRNLVSDELRLPPLRAHTAAATQVLAGYREQFELGKRSLLDVLDAQNELQLSRLSLTDGEYRVLLDHFALIGTSGALLDNFGIPVPKGSPKNGKGAK